MTQRKSINEQLQSRSGPIWRWIASGLVFLNLLVLAQCLFSTFRPDLWAGNEPFKQFAFLSVAIVFLQITPFARSIWVGNSALQIGEIDEHERAINQRVMAKAYQTTGIAMLLVLFLLLISADVLDIQLSSVSGGYWLMWYTQLFFSMPVIYAGFDPITGTGADDED